MPWHKIVIPWWNETKITGNHTLSFIVHVEYDGFGGLLCQESLKNRVPAEVEGLNYIGTAVVQPVINGVCELILGLSNSIHLQVEYELGGVGSKLVGLIGGADHGVLTLLILPQIHNFQFDVFHIIEIG